MITRSKEDVLRFLSDITGPVGPEVFVGYGSSVLNGLAKDSMNEETIIGNWINESNKTLLLKELLEIAIEPDVGGVAQTIKTRFREDWDYSITRVVYELCDSGELSEAIRYLAGRTETEEIAKELELWRN